MLGDRAFHLFGQRLPLYDLVVMGITVVVGAALWWLLYRHRAGVQMRAVVDDRTLLSLNGVSPVRTARLSWIIGVSTAVLAGVLIAPRTSLSATSLALLIMNAFAAAVIGRLRSLTFTVLGALILGLATAYAQGYVGSNADLPGWQYLIGLVNVVPAVVLFVALQFLPAERLRASRTLQRRERSVRPTWTGSAALAGAVVLATVAVVPLVGPGDLHTMTRIWGLALVALSLVPLLGWAGRLAVCPFAFAVVGALGYAHLTPGGALWGLVVAALGGAVVAAGLSLLAVRLSPLYLALATAAFAITLDSWVLGLPPFDAVVRVPFTDVTLYRHRIDLFQGGSLDVARPHLPGLDLSGDTAFFVFTAVVFALALVALTALRRSTFGLELLASADSALGYETLGRSRRRTTVAAFAVSGCVAGVGGALFAAAAQRPSPEAFGFFGGLSILVIVVIFGVASLGSAVAAGTILASPFLANLFPSLPQLTPALTATAGVGLGDDPNGAIASGLRPAWSPWRSNRALLAGGGGVVAAAYGLTVAGIFSNWIFVGVLGAVLVGLPACMRERRPRATPTLRATPEQLALDLPLSAADLATLDEVLGCRR
jgi:branched-chain amino acid transport system permease protein